MTRPARRRGWGRTATVALATVLATLASACAGGEPPSAVPPPPADALEWTDPEVDLTDVSLAVGAKQSNVDQVLAEIAVTSLEAGGASVTPELDLGGPADNRDAQIAGLIDLYWESLGTAFVELRREAGPSPDPADLFDSLQERDLVENDLSWLPPAPADPSPVVIAAPDLPNRLQADSVSELESLFTEDPDDFAVCVGGDGGLPLAPSGALDLTLALEVTPDEGQFVAVPPEDLVTLVTESPFCPYGLLSRTSPLLLDADVEVLADDIGAFVPLNPAVVVRAEVLDTWPAIEDVFAAVAPLLDDEELRRLAAEANEPDADPEEIARRWLVDQGLAEGTP